MENAKEIFKSLDKDNSESLDRSEVEILMNKLRGATTGRARSLTKVSPLPPLTRGGTKCPHHVVRSKTH